MDTHQLWVACGRPRSGPIYTARCRARAEYRGAMKYKTQIANTDISNDMHDVLMTWMAAPMLPILSTVLLVAFNRPVCQTAQITARNWKTDLKTNFVDKCIGDMKLQKAAGVNGIETEHMRYAHPRICVILALLFNAMLIYGVVPSMFGMGIIVPLIKGHNMVVHLTITGVSHLMFTYPKSLKCVFWIFMAIISLLQICSSVSKSVLVVIMPYVQYSLSWGISLMATQLFICVL